MSYEYSDSYDWEELIDTLNNQVSKISDLEAKLAESEIRSKESEIFYKREINRRDTKLRNIKQQLAEKEKELNDWKDGTIICKWTDAENKVKDLEHQLSEKEELIIFADRTIKGLVLAKEIDKISFAVDILEELADCSNYINGKLDFECGSYVSEKAIRDKIKYLKGKKDE